ncbi:MAG: ABC transporter permease subunit [Traorella sp.]
MNLKKPIVLFLLLLQCFLLGNSIYQYHQKNERLAQMSLTVFDSYSRTLDSEYQLYQFKEQKQSSLYEKALTLNADLYSSCHFSMTLNDTCYEKEIDFNTTIITLIEEYNYRSPNSIHKLNQANYEYTYLISEKMDYEYDERLSALHFFINYCEDGFFWIIVFIGLILSCFSIADNYEQGNLKTLALFPLSRDKWLLAKLISLVWTLLFVLLIPLILVLFGLTFMVGFGNLNYPYVVYLVDHYAIFSEMQVALLYLGYLILLSCLIIVIGFVFSYSLKEGISALLLATSLLSLLNILWCNVSLLKPSAYLLFTTYLDIPAILRGDLAIQKNLEHLNILYACLIFSSLIIGLLFVLILDYRKKDLLDS